MQPVLDDGIYDVIAVATDHAGNIGYDTTRDEVEIDATPPPRPTVRDLITNEPLPIIAGTAVGPVATLESTSRWRVGSWLAGGQAHCNNVAHYGFDLSAAGVNPRRWHLRSHCHCSAKPVVLRTDLSNNELTIDTTGVPVPTVVSQYK